MTARHLVELEILQASADTGPLTIKVGNFGHPSRQADVMVVAFGKYGAPVPTGVIR